MPPTSSVASRPMPLVNPNLALARSLATFDSLSLTYFLYDGPELTKRKKFIQNVAVRELEKEGFKKHSQLSREEIYEESLRKTIFFFKKCHELNLRNSHDQAWVRAVFFPTEATSFDVHHAMFIPTLRKLSTKEQKDKWLPLAESYEILGTYAQTELGHGTFLRGLETIVTYDNVTKEFIIDSPTITSTKFWPGALGKTSNFCIVMAKLFIDGRDRGMQSFLVQLRDLDTHKPLPGISVGDIGTKFGFPGMDNGFLGLSKVRIPRENMLMRYVQVLDDGTFIQPKNDRLVYGTMTFVRAQIAADVAMTLAKAVTIATRYSAVRIQSEINPGTGEVPVLDFQTQQYKLFVQIATAYALIFSGKSSVALYNKVSIEIEKGNLGELPMLHAVSSGLKAFNSWAMAFGVEQCRFACGGHGYLQASGIPKIYVNKSAACTYEGENTVMALQTARFLNKCFEAGKRGNKLPPAVRSLTRKEARSKLTEKLELEHLITAFEQRAAICVFLLGFSFSLHL